MALCTPQFGRSQSFVNHSPVQPCRESSRYRIDSRPSIAISERSTSLFQLSSSSQGGATYEPKHMLRRKKAYDALTQAAPQPPQTQPAAGDHRRNSSLDKVLKKLQSLVKHKDRAVDMWSMQADAGSPPRLTDSAASTLHCKTDMLNLRFEFEQPQSKLQVPSRPKSTRSEDRDSAWVTDDESDTEGGVALRCSKETWKMTHERQLMSRRPFRNW